MKTKYKRILIKLSGEALAGSKKTGVCYDTVLDICKKIKEVNDMGVEVGIVVGVVTFGEEDKMKSLIGRQQTI